MEIKKLICAVAVMQGITSCNGQAQKKTESMTKKTGSI